MQHSDPKIKAIPADVDVEDFEFPQGEGGEPLARWEDDDLLYEDDHDREMELFETAETATGVALDVVEDDAEWQGYTAEEEEEVRALVVGNLICAEAQRAYEAAGNDPSAAAHAVLRLLVKTQEQIREQLQHAAFPILSIGGDDEIVDPT